MPFNLADLRAAIPDPVRMAINELLTPPPDGVTATFRTALFPVHDPAQTLLSVVTLGVPPARTALTLGTDWLWVDEANGILELLVNPLPVAGSMLRADRYTWSLWGDDFLGGLADKYDYIEYAVIDCLRIALQDLESGAFLKYQIGDDITDRTKEADRLRKNIADLYDKLETKTPTQVDVIWRDRGSALSTPYNESYGGWSR